MTIDPNSPTKYVETFDKVMLVLGDRESGRSTFIRSFNPIAVMSYYPKFSGDRKKLVTDLGRTKEKSIIGIETGLPALVENSDVFLKELALLAKIRKHIYLVEWRVHADENYIKFMGSTYSKFASTIFVTKGITKDAETLELSGGRFSGIGSFMKDSPDWFLEYSVVKHNQEAAIELENVKYNVSNYVPKELASRSQ